VRAVAEHSENREKGTEIQVLDSDCRNLTFLDRADVIFAVLYGIFFIWGLVLTLISI